jgi:hypothetical protein
MTFERRRRATRRLVATREETIGILTKALITLEQEDQVVNCVNLAGAAGKIAKSIGKNFFIGFIAQRMTDEERVALKLPLKKKLAEL